MNATLRDVAKRVLPEPALGALRSVRRNAVEVKVRLGRLKPSGLSIDRYSNPAFLRIVYNVILQRQPDEAGFRHYLRMLRRYELTRLQLIDIMRGSEEYRLDVGFKDLMTSLHHSRCAFVQQLPAASRILDIGGTHQSNREGAMVRMGYPYAFDELVILDLPHEDRHAIYQHSERVERVETRLGPVTYRYGTMADLSQFADASFDLVYSGQSIEHVTPQEAEVTLKEVSRVLRPGGWFALDTPNGPVCRLQSPSFINDDHKVEYSHAEMLGMLAAADFEVVAAKGLNYLGGPAATTPFSVCAVAAGAGVYDAIEDCYLLAYVARKPET